MDGRTARSSPVFLQSAHGTGSPKVARPTLFAGSRRARRGMDRRGDGADKSNLYHVEDGKITFRDPWRAWRTSRTRHRTERFGSADLGAFGTWSMAVLPELRFRKKSPARA